MYRSIIRRLCLGISCVLVSTSASTEPRSGEKWAVLIAVDDYLNAGDLKYCGADQQALQEQLIKSGFDERQIYLLSDKAEDKKLFPFRANIRRQIETVAKFAEKGDLVLIAFSGHGVHLEKTSYLCPTDAKLDEPETLISMEWIYQQLEKSPADLRVVMVDACRNDPRPPGQRSLSTEEVRDGSRAFVEATQRLPDGVILINSCEEGEVSQEDPDFGHGVFMHFVLEGLSGKADKDQDKQVTLQEMVNHAAKETKLYVEKKYNDSQRPRVKGNFDADAMQYTVSLLTTSSTRPTKTKPATPTDPDDPDANEVITNSIGMKLVLIPAGEFLMGCPETDKDARDIEKPQHKVRITQPFYLGETEVTQSQWQAVMGTEPWVGKEFVKTEPDKAATQVSWEDAVEYCKQLSRQEGEVYELPTEAQWEYACRGGTTTMFSFGDDASELSDYGWWGGQFGDGNAKGEQHAHRVGLKKPNPFGLYDMHGNVWEWSRDVYDEKAYGKRSGTTPDPVVNSGSDFRVLRGGSWLGRPRYASSAARGWNTPVERYSSLGFRVSRTK